MNDRDFKKRPGSRREAYLEEEKEFMQPLPSEPYESAIWSPDLKVGNDYLVSDGMNKYSVPYDLIGEKVNLRLHPTPWRYSFVETGLPSTPAAKCTSGIR